VETVPLSERFPPWVLRGVTGALLVVLIGWSFVQRWHVLSASPFPIGVDGYFYPIQVRSLLEHGTLAYPASPFAFWFMAPFAAATDPIVGAKIAAALGGALIAIPAYLVGARLGRGRGPGLIAATIATTSAGSAYLSIEFVKQGIGLTVALFALWLVLRAIEQRSRGRVIGAVLAIAAALLTHKVAAALVILVAVPAAFAEARGTGALRGRRLLYLIAGSVVIAAIAIVLGLVFPQRFISASDLALVGNVVTRTAHWEAPALVTPRVTLSFEYEALTAAALALVGITVLIAQRPRVVHPVPKHSLRRYAATAVAIAVLALVIFLQRVSLVVCVDLFVALASCAVIAQFWRSVRFEQAPSERIAAWVIVALAIVVGLPFLAVSDPQGLAFRLRISAFVPLALCAAIVARAVLAKLRELERDLACVVIAVVLAGRTAGFDRTEGQVLMHPALVTAAMALDVPSNATVIVSERHIEFMVAWYTHASVSLRPELVPYNRRVRLLLPLSPVNTGWPLERALDAARHEPAIDPPIGVHPRHRNGLVRVTETTWDWMLTQMPDRARRHFAAWPTI
jgi:hypothetical protein